MMERNEDSAFGEFAHYEALQEAQEGDGKTEETKKETAGNMKAMLIGLAIFAVIIAIACIFT